MPDRQRRPDRDAPHRRVMALRACVGLVAVAGVGSLALPQTWTEPIQTWLPALIFLTLVSIVLEFVIVPLPAGGSFSMATIPHVAVILLVPAPFAAASIGLSVLVEQAVHRSPAVKVIFNVAGMLLTGSVASLAMGLFGNLWQVAPQQGEGARLVLTFVVVAVAYFGTNALLTSLVLALAEERPILQVIRRGAGGGTLLGELAATAIGAHLALIWVIEPVLTAVLIAPATVIARSFDYIRRLNSETRAAVQSLAEIVDHRDPTTFRHSERVAVNASALARLLGLTDAEIENIEQAASVHDLGKIGVPDRVLLKPGPLTVAEQASMRQHTELGSEILTRFHLFAPGAEIVRHHHERWDGGGYPDGLAGEAIPLGARVVAVADAYDAMTSDRPYRAALSPAEALRRLAAGSGTQWEPRMVEAFLELMADPARAAGLAIHGRPRGRSAPRRAGQASRKPLHGELEGAEV